MAEEVKAEPPAEVPAVPAIPEPIAPIAPAPPAAPAGMTPEQAIKYHQDMALMYATKTGQTPRAGTATAVGKINKKIHSGRFSRALKSTTGSFRSFFSSIGSSARSVKSILGRAARPLLVLGSRVGRNIATFREKARRRVGARLPIFSGYYRGQALNSQLKRKLSHWDRLMTDSTAIDGVREYELSQGEDLDTLVKKIRKDRKKSKNILYTYIDPITEKKQTLSATNQDAFIKLYQATSALGTTGALHRINPDFAEKEHRNYFLNDMHYNMTDWVQAKGLPKIARMSKAKYEALNKKDKVRIDTEHADYLDEFKKEFKERLRSGRDVDWYNATSKTGPHATFYRKYSTREMERRNARAMREIYEEQLNSK
jgi:hypothetical protein